MAERLRLGRRSKKARIPQTQEEKSAPLYVPPSTGHIDLQAVRRLMNEPTRRRFDVVLAAITAGAPPPSTMSARRGNIHADDCQRLCEGGVVRRADLTKPTRGVGIGFTVVEEKDGALRRRFIFWDPESNKWYQAEVGSEIRLGHVSDALRDVYHDVGTIRDGEGGFLGVRLPEEASPAYRFYDNQGDLWEMACLPVGISGAPELCQLIFGTIAGHPEYAAKQHVLHTTKPAAIRVHIDDIGVRHHRDDTVLVERFFAERSRLTGVRFKSSGVTGSPHYIFLGLLWDHDAKAIGLSDKLLRKLAEAKRLILEETLTYADLESLSGRLIYADCALGQLLAYRYFTMKAIRHVLRAADVAGAVCVMPEHLQRALLLWIDALSVKRMFPVRPLGNRQTAWLFTDASLKGWGAVLVTSAGKVFVIGKSWTLEHKSGDISYLEALAVSRATVTLAPTLRAEEVATLHVIVDNTSVEAAVRRGIARSPTVNWALLGGLLELKELSIGVTIRYIKSGDNPADCVSRGAPVNLDRLSVVVDRIRRQGGREARGFLPSTVTQSAKKNVIALG
jgi:hypothetical protein